MLVQVNKRHLKFVNVRASLLTALNVVVEILSGKIRYPVWQHTFVSPSAFSRRAVVSYWRKYVHEVLVNRLGGLSLPRKSVVRLTDRPDMTLDVYRGRKTTMQLSGKNDIFMIFGVIFHNIPVSFCDISLK